MTLQELASRAEHLADTYDMDLSDAIDRVLDAHPESDVTWAEMMATITRVPLSVFVTDDCDLWDNE